MTQFELELDEDNAMEPEVDDPKCGSGTTILMRKYEDEQQP